MPLEVGGDLDNANSLIEELPLSEGGRGIYAFASVAPTLLADGSGIFAQISITIILFISDVVHMHGWRAQAAEQPSASRKNKMRHGSERGDEAVGELEPPLLHLWPRDVGVAPLIPAATYLT